MAINTSCVIHYTKTIDNLISILKDNFKIHFCHETMEYKYRTENFLVPMVSFCDIPLSKIQEHVEKYGKYGIGLTKEWAIKNGLNPVIYLSKESKIADAYKSLAYLINFIQPNEKIKDIEKFKNKLNNLIMLYSFAKPHNGKLPHSEIEYKFYDEKEWRYVCDFITSDTLDKYINLINCDFALKDRIRASKDTLNELIKNERLYFEPNDIKYLIVEKEEDILKIIDAIKQSKKQKYEEKDILRLTARILTIEQIENDF